MGEWISARQLLLVQPRAGEPAARRRSCCSRRPSTCHGAVAIVQLAGPLPAAVDGELAYRRARWRRGSRRRASRSRRFSSGKSSAPWRTPCVSEPCRCRRCGRWPGHRRRRPRGRRRRAPGSRSLASSAVQRPVKPAPTTARSQLTAPVSAGRGAGAPRRRARTARVSSPAVNSGQRATVRDADVRDACMRTTLPGGERRSRPGEVRRARGDGSDPVGRDGRSDRAADPAARLLQESWVPCQVLMSPSLGAPRAGRQTLSRSEQVRDRRT